MEKYMPNAAIQDFALWLDERCLFLRNLEAEADHALHKNKNPDKYRTLMCQKALFLEALPEEAEERLANLPEEAADMAAKRLNRFSRRAAQALDIDSVFYMYALLYPDDHVKGQPNALELFAAEIAAMAKN